VLLAGLLAPREWPAWQLLGAAYFTLRNLHVLLDGWMSGSQGPGLRAMLQYQFFLPVLVAGPIHRFPNFRRALSYRRFDRTEIAAGAERALLGLAQATILGVALMGRTPVVLGAPGQGFWSDWALSAAGWIQLYFVFAGLSSFAVGVSRMMGIAIEENFNNPFASRSLLEFWTRWHMSLSFWARDYVFQPVSAATRQPIVGLAAAMLVIGIWHETSIYYVLWSGWQVTGVVLNRLLSAWADRRGFHLSDRLRSLMGPLAVLGWLSLAQPLIATTLSSFG
jgi:alginate O-acetyltransferase complex protein AlgI